MKLGKTMKRLGFASSMADDCLYIRKEKGIVKVLVLVYVDNMTIAATDIRDVKWFKMELGMVFQITDLGELRHILGICVRRDRMARTIQLDQTSYIQALLSQYKMDGSMPVTMPAVVKE